MFTKTNQECPKGAVQLRAMVHPLWLPTGITQEAVQSADAGVSSPEKLM